MLFNVFVEFPSAVQTVVSEVVDLHGTNLIE